MRLGLRGGSTASRRAVWRCRELISGSGRAQPTPGLVSSKTLAAATRMARDRRAGWSQLAHVGVWRQMEQAASRRRWPWTGRTYEPPLRASDHFYRSRVGCGCLRAAGVRFGVGLVTFQCLRVSGGCYRITQTVIFYRPERHCVKPQSQHIVRAHTLAQYTQKQPAEGDRAADT